MTVDNERILALQNKLKQAVSHVAPDLDGSGPPDTAADGARGAVKGPVEPARTIPEPLLLLVELVMARDEYLRHELLRLQRTLSRQSFRGAESARRLVRRLARKAEQNVDDLRSWTAHPRASLGQPAAWSATEMTFTPEDRRDSPDGAR